MAFQENRGRCQHCFNWIVSHRRLNAAVLASASGALTALLYIPFITGDAPVVKQHPKLSVVAYLFLVPAVTYVAKIAGDYVDFFHRHYKLIRPESFVREWTQTSSTESIKLTLFALLVLSTALMGALLPAFFLYWLPEAEQPVLGVGENPVLQDFHRGLTYTLAVGLGAYVGFLVPWVVTEFNAVSNRLSPLEAKDTVLSLRSRFTGNWGQRGGYNYVEGVGDDLPELEDQPPNIPEL